MNSAGQQSKLEQVDMGDVLAFPIRPALRPVSTPKGTSPNKGYEATGRTREHLTQPEINTLLDGARKTGKNRHRNYCIILVGFRHGLRVGEIAALRWSDVDLNEGSVFVRRLKGSKSSTHPLHGDEIRALKKLQRESPSSPYVFVDSQGSPLATSAISSMVKRLGKGLFPFPIHTHMLRHSCGFHLANKGVDTRTIQDYLGHRNIQHTVRYTELSPNKFRGLWD